jgi:predicted nuclease of predicted toxin-antitoxin system
MSERAGNTDQIREAVRERYATSGRVVTDNDGSRQALDVECCATSTAGDKAIITSIDSLTNRLRERYQFNFQAT